MVVFTGYIIVTPTLFVAIGVAKLNHGAKSHFSSVIHYNAFVSFFINFNPSLLNH